MFIRFRRIFALWIDCVVLFPLIFVMSMWSYNQIAHLGGTNVNLIQLILALNRYSVVLYLIFIAPIMYIAYELMCYLTFKRTLGQYFMGMKLDTIDPLAMLFRNFFAISLHLISVGAFSLLNGLISLINGKSAIDYLSRSQPTFITQPLKHPIFKLGVLMSVIVLSLALNIGAVRRLQTQCFEIQCIEQIILKDAINRQVLQQQLQLDNLNQQKITVTSQTYTQLQADFSATALTSVNTNASGYDRFSIQFGDGIQVFPINSEQVFTITPDMTGDILVAKDQSNQENWQTYVWSENAQQFLPVRTVFTIQSQNSYQWLMNVSSQQQVNTQWTLYFTHDFGRVSEIHLEK